MIDRIPHRDTGLRARRDGAGRVAPLAALLLACAAPACGGKGEAAEAGLSGARLREPTKVIVAPVEQREMVRRLETTTRVESVHEVEVYPRTTGVLTELLVEEGQRVEAGATLARIDDRALVIAREDARAALEEARESLPQLALAVEEAEAKLATATQSHEQRQRDHQRNLAISAASEGRPGLLSAKELDDSALALELASGELEAARLARERAKLEHQAAGRAIERAQLALSQAELELSYASILAPFDGVVASRSVDVGDSISPSTPTFVLTNPDLLRAVFYRPQRELPLFHAAAIGDDANGAGGLALLARADGLPDVEFQGWIERVSPTVDPESGNFRVTARVETGAEPNRLLPGMLVRLEIITDRHPQALVVPKKAIAREGDVSLIYVVRDGRAVRLPVAEGFADGDYVEVTVLEGGALGPGEPVVTVGKDLQAGDEVQATEALAGGGQVEASEPSDAAPAGDGGGRAHTAGS